MSMDGKGLCLHNLVDDCPICDNWPVHQPECLNAPIPGRHWFAGCEPGGDWDPEYQRYGGSGPRVNPTTGICEGCSQRACRVCGREACPDHPGYNHANYCGIIGHGCTCGADKEVMNDHGDVR